MQSSGPFCAVYIVDLFVHSSGPFGGPFSDGGGGGVLQSPENPPWLRPWRYTPSTCNCIPIFGHFRHLSTLVML